MDARKKANAKARKKAKVKAKKSLYDASVEHYFDKDLMKAVDNATASSAHTATKYLPATKVLMDMPDPPMPFPKTWGTSPRCTSNVVNCIHTEDQVTTLVEGLLHDVIQALGLQDKLLILRNKIILDVAPDLVVVMASNILPIGFFEVKKPKGFKSKDDDAKIFGTDPSEVTGQVYEQLSLIQLNGPKRPIGVLTTWNEWQLISKHKFVEVLPSPLPSLAVQTGGSPDPAVSPVLDDNDQVQLEQREQLEQRATISSPTDGERARGKRFRSDTAEGGKVRAETAKGGKSKTNRARGKKVRAMLRSNAVVAVSTPGEPVEGGDDTSAAATDRTVYASKVVRAGKEVGKFIISALYLMLHAAGDRNTILHKPLNSISRKLVFGRKDFYIFTYEDLSLQDGIKFDTCPVGKEKIIYIWTPLAAGENGSTCLATDKEGNACVIKFYNHVDINGIEETTNAATIEYDNWKNIYLQNNKKWSFCGLKKLGSRKVPCLLMPYLRGVTKKERPALMKGKQNSPLWEALHSFAQKGYRHDDLKWHHVGTYWDGETRKVAFTDLGQVSIVEDGAAWVEAAFMELKNRAGSAMVDNLLE